MGSEEILERYPNARYDETLAIEFDEDVAKTNDTILSEVLKDAMKEQEEEKLPKEAEMGDSAIDLEPPPKVNKKAVVDIDEFTKKIENLNQRNKPASTERESSKQDEMETNVNTRTNLQSEKTVEDLNISVNHKTPKSSTIEHERRGRKEKEQSKRNSLSERSLNNDENKKRKESSKSIEREEKKKKQKVRSISQDSLTEKVEREKLNKSIPSDTSFDNDGEKKRKELSKASEKQESTKKQERWGGKERRGRRKKG